MSPATAPPVTPTASPQLLCLGLQGWALSSCAGQAGQAADTTLPSVLLQASASQCPHPCRLPSIQGPVLVQQPCSDQSKATHSTLEDISSQYKMPSKSFSPHFFLPPISLPRYQSNHHTAVTSKGSDPPRLPSTLVPPPDTLPCSGRPRENVAWLVAFILTKSIRRSSRCLFLGTRPLCQPIMPAGIQPTVAELGPLEEMTPGAKLHPGGHPIPTPGRGPAVPPGRGQAVVALDGATPSGNQGLLLPAASPEQPPSEGPERGAKGSWRWRPGCQGRAGIHAVRQPEAGGWKRERCHLRHWT